MSIWQAFLIHFFRRIKVVSALVFTLRVLSNLPIVYDNGFDLIIAKVDDEFPEESIEPTLEQLSENLRKGSRSGANVKIKIRKLEKISDGVSKPVVIGEVQKNVKMN